MIAQRLVRKICENCREAYEPDERERVWLSALEAPPQDAAFFHGRGCGDCNQTGYRGRLGVYELLEIDESVATPLREGNQSEYERAARARPEFRPIALAALDYARRGITTIQEVFRLAEEVEEVPAEEGSTEERLPDLVVEHEGRPGEADSFQDAGESLEGGVEAYIGE